MLTSYTHLDDVDIRFRADLQQGDLLQGDLAEKAKTSCVHKNFASSIAHAE